MTDRPIIFSVPMIRAILSGRKTQTRRVLSQSNTQRDGWPWPKLYPWNDHDWANAWVDIGFSKSDRSEQYLHVPYPDGDTTHRIYPKWESGDRLWVRETFAYEPDEYEWTVSTSVPARQGGLWYRADGDIAGARWQPSIHMPRWASRITMEVTGIRIERLQDISEADAVDEGVGQDSDGWTDYQMPSTQCCSSARESFVTLWNSLHGPSVWDANPWVAVIEFKRAENGQ